MVNVLDKAEPYSAVQTLANRVHKIELLAGLRGSVVSLYEVSDIVRDTSVRARDLLRGNASSLNSRLNRVGSLMLK
jgi:hypothetical protein